jgi:hypothetical protein
VDLAQPGRVAVIDDRPQAEALVSPRHYVSAGLLEFGIVLRCREQMVGFE